LLRRNRFGGPVSLDWEKHWHPEGPEQAGALQAALAAGWYSEASEKY
jgi:hypothetical protein